MAVTVLTRVERRESAGAAADLLYASASLLELPRFRDVPPIAPQPGDGSQVRTETDPVERS